jgi:hypothetical protein
LLFRTVRKRAGHTAVAAPFLHRPYTLDLGDLMIVQLLVNVGCRGHLVSFDQRNEKLIRRRNPCVCVLFLPLSIF